MNIVAHEDDDLLFINPSVSDDLAAGRCVTTVYVTAGDAGRARSYWLGRERGARDAYAAMAGNDNAWREDTLAVNGRSLTRFTLPRTQATLIFLRLPDAHTTPDHPQDALRRLWTGTLPTLRTIDDGDYYTRTALVETLATLMTTYHPDEIHTLDYAGHYGDGDHDDHHTAGYLTEAAQRTYATPHQTTAYLGYNVSQLPPNLPTTTRDTKLAHFLAYAAHDPKVCQSATACLSNFYAPRFSHQIQTATNNAY